MRSSSAASTNTWACSTATAARSPPPASRAWTSSSTPAPELSLPRTFVEDGHVDHGYATTAHKAQGATVDQAFVLGSRESYREWGYTALTRHRDQAHFYITAPKPFLNQEPETLDDPEQLKLFLADTLDDTRQHELATDLVDQFGLEDLTHHDPIVTDEMRRQAHELLEDLDRPFEPGPPEPPDLTDDLGMDFGM